MVTEAIRRRRFLHLLAWVGYHLKIDPETKKWKLASAKMTDPTWYHVEYQDIDRIVDKEKAGRYLKESAVTGKLMFNPYVVEAGRLQNPQS